MNGDELLRTAARAASIYVFMLVVVRVLGKRTIGNLTAFDLIVALIMGDLMGEMIYGNVSLVQGLIAVGSVAVLHLLNSALGFRFPKLEMLFSGKPKVLIKDGQMQRAAMAAEHVNADELACMLREHGIADAGGVRLGTLEVNGRLSVIKAELPGGSKDDGDTGDDDDGDGHVAGVH